MANVTGGDDCRLDLDAMPPPPKGQFAPSPFLAAAGGALLLHGLQQLSAAVSPGGCLAVASGLGCVGLSVLLQGWAWSRDLYAVDNAICLVTHVMGILSKQAQLHPARDVARLRAINAPVDALMSKQLPKILKKTGFRELDPLLVPRPADDQAGGPDVTVRLFRPREAPEGARLPLLIEIHGGGMVIGSANGGGGALKHWCELLKTRAAKDDAGVTCDGAMIASVDYRRAPEHPFPAPADDATYAVRFLVKHAAELGVARDAIVVAGPSAGANLALVAAREVSAEGCKLRGVVAVVPMVTPHLLSQSYRQFGGLSALPTEVMQFWWSCYTPDNFSPHAAAADPRFNLLAPSSSFAGLPPTVVAVAHADPLRDEGIELARKLRTEGVSVTAVRIRGTHSFGPTADRAGVRALGHEVRRLLGLSRLVD